MAFVFPQFIRDQLAADATLFDGQNLAMALFYQAPLFTSGDTRYTAVETLDDLRAEIGWTEAVVDGYPLSDDVFLAPVTEFGASTYVMMDEFPLDADMLSVQVRAVVFFIRGTVGGVTDPVVLITNTPVKPVVTLRGNDSIVPVPDPKLASLPDDRWVFGWETTNPGASLTEGLLAVSIAPPEFEPAHTQHVWLFPQRVNVIANPNFELGVNHWRSNGDVAQVSESGSMMGEFTSTAPLPDPPDVPLTPLVVESNKFPGRISNDWTIRLTVRGNGNLRVGLVGWPIEFDETVSDWGSETFLLPGDGYAQINVLRSLAEIYEGQLRLETDGTELIIDRVVCEPGFLIGDPRWGYFDGDTTYGARDDYSWYGGENLKGQTYSLWYNNKRATAGRLFATKFPDRAALTNEDELAEGLVYQWVPAGTLVEPHWDTLFEGDLQHEVPDLAGTPVTPYMTTNPGDPGHTTDMGVADPWYESIVYVPPVLPPPPFNVIDDFAWNAAHWAEDPGWTKTDGQTVSPFPDASGHSKHIPYGAGGVKWEDNSATLGNKPVVDFTASGWIGLSPTVYTAPFSIVWIGRIKSLVHNSYLYGFGGNGPGFFMESDGDFFLYYGGVVAAGTIDTNPHMHVLYVPSTAVPLVRNTDGVDLNLSMNGGALNTSHTCLGALQGGSGNGGNTEVGFFGVYPGDIRAHAKWAELLTWAERYGV